MRFVKFKRLVSFFIILSLISVLPPIATASVKTNKIILLPSDDAYVSEAAPDSNFAGSEIMYSKKVSKENKNDRNMDYSTFLKFTPSDSNTVADNLNLTKSENKFYWFAFDVTSYVYKTYTVQKKNDITFALAVSDLYTTNAEIYSKENSVNKPFLELTVTPDGKTVSKAVLYLYIRHGVRKPVLFSVKGQWSEDSVTFKNRPSLDKKIVDGVVDSELSGVELPDESGETLGGYGYDALNTINYISSKQPSVPVEDVIDVTKLPGGKQMIEDLIRKNPDNLHPRVICTPESLERVKKHLDTDPYLKKWYADFSKQAEKHVLSPEATYNLSGGQLESNAKSAGVTLALMWHLTGDRKYAEAARTLLLTAVEMPDWNPSKALNTGEVAMGVGYAYDLMYDYLSETDRKTITKGIEEKGFAPFLGRPVTQSNNWNPVLNGGLSIAALAIGDEREESSAKILEQSIKALPTAIVEFCPDGAFPEGGGYWSYTVSALFGYFSSMNNALGTAYGLDEIPGVNKTGYFPLVISGTKKDTRLYYGDDNSKDISNTALLWMAERYNNNDFALIHFKYLEACEENGIFDYSNVKTDFNPLWYNPEKEYGSIDELEKFKNDSFLNGLVSIGTMRSNWNDENALFVGFKGGYNRASHGNQDIGTFTLSALGVNWINLPANGPYDRAGYPEFFRMGRYRYYANSPQGQNTLFFNPGKNYPDMSFGQNPEAQGNFIKTGSSVGGGYAILDMTSAYNEHVTSAQRGFMLTDNRTRVVIQDEIKSDKKNEIYWFMHINKEVEAEISADGKIAVLKSGNKRLKCSIDSPVDGKFELMDAEALPKTPNVREYDEMLHSGVKKLFIRLNAQNVTLSVSLVPCYENHTGLSKTYSVVPLSSWQIPEASGFKSGSILIDGSELEGFDSDKYWYSVHVTGDVYPKVDAVFAENDNVEITQADDNNGVAVIKVKNQNGQTAEYVIFFEKEPPKSNIIVTAEDVPEKENVPENTLDGNLETRWTSQDESWILFDLGEEKELSCVSLAFYKGMERNYPLSIELSSDGVEFIRVYEGQSSGATIQLEKFAFEKKKARFVRVNVNGNSVNNWNGIVEAQFE